MVRLPRRRGGNRGRAPPDRGEGCRAGRRRSAVLPALRAGARIVPHRSEPIRRIGNPGSLPHPDGRQPAKPLRGIPVPLTRRRDEISRKLPSMVSTRLPRRKRKPVNLPRSRRQFGMHTNRKMSHQIKPVNDNTTPNRRPDTASGARSSNVLTRSIFLIRREKIKIEIANSVIDK